MKETDMKKLETKFTRSGFEHEQIKRVGNIAMYRRTKQGNAHVEVVKIGRHNGYPIPGHGPEIKMAPPAEFYPSSESWGTNGFTFQNEAVAETKFAEMVAAEEAKALTPV